MLCDFATWWLDVYYQCEILVILSPISYTVLSCATEPKFFLEDVTPYKERHYFSLLLDALACLFESFFLQPLNKNGVIFNFKTWRVLWRGFLWGLYARVTACVWAKVAIFLLVLSVAAKRQLIASYEPRVWLYLALRNPCTGFNAIPAPAMCRCCRCLLLPIAAKRPHYKTGDRGDPATRSRLTF